MKGNWHLYKQAKTHEYNVNGHKVDYYETLSHLKAAPVLPELRVVLQGYLKFNRATQSHVFSTIVQDIYNHT